LRVRAAALLAAKVFAAIESDQQPPVEPLKVLQAAVLPHLLQRVLEARLEQFGQRRVEQIANVIVAGDLLDAKQRLAVGGVASMLHAPLMR